MLSTGHQATTILVVEDDSALRKMYRAALQVEGFAVDAVEDGVDALRHLDEDRPALVILDLELPRLGGRDVHREITGRADTRHIPVIVVTGGDTADLNPQDFAAILRKPFGPDALISAVRQSLSKARL